MSKSQKPVKGLPKKIRVFKKTENLIDYTVYTTTGTGLFERLGFSTASYTEVTEKK